MLRRIAVWGLLAAACCSKNEPKGSSGGAAAAGPDRPTFSVFALAEVRGQIGPCGCTTDPLGDISRTARLVADARAQGPVMVVDAGSLLYSRTPVPAHLDAQEELKADLLADIYKEQLRISAIGVGPADLAKGASKWRLPRTAANVAGAEPGKIEVVGGTKVGVFGVVASEALAMEIADPVAAGKAQVAKLRAQGAQVVIALIQAATKKDAVKLLRAINGAATKTVPWAGIDFAVAGLGTNAPEPDQTEIAADRVDNTWLVVPANRGQIVSRIDVYMRGQGALFDAIGATSGGARVAQLDKEIAQRDEELAKFAADGAADPAFVAIKQRERQELADRRARLKAQPMIVPASGPFFTLSQLRIGKSLACSPQAQSAVSAFYAAAGKANVKAAADKAVAKPKPGQPSYVGSDSCSDCHGEAVDFWAKTSHAKAWQTLVDRGQQFDYDCIGCHVSGFEKPGGSNLTNNDKLRDVQCEVCHGPASIHVAEGGEEQPMSVWRKPPEDLCASQCHTPEHSDTFQLKAYLRDVVGPGHGEALAKELGPGETGRALRKAGLDKAGRKLGAECIR